MCVCVCFGVCVPACMCVCVFMHVHVCVCFPLIVNNWAFNQWLLKFDTCITISFGQI